MSIDLARLCEAIIDAAATELRRQQEEGAAQEEAKPATAYLCGSYSHRLDALCTRPEDHAGDHGADWKGHSVTWARQPSAVPVPSPAPTVPAADREDVEDELEYLSRHGYVLTAAVIRGRIATLRARVEQLTAEVAALRPVVDAAREWCSKWDRNAAALGDAVHEYERARLKAQGGKA